MDILRACAFFLFFDRPVCVENEILTSFSKMEEGGHVHLELHPNAELLYDRHKEEAHLTSNLSVSLSGWLVSACFCNLTCGGWGEQL